MDARAILTLVMAHESGVLLPEFDIGSRRIDLLCVDDRSLRGYEIKADTDRVTGGRFGWQLREYVKFCEVLTYVVVPRFAIHCLQKTPRWVGVTVVTPEGALVVVRHPGKNPDVTAADIARRLRKTEATAKVKALGLYYGQHQRCASACTRAEMHDSPSRKCTSGLREMLVSAMADEELRLYVRQTIATRTYSVASPGRKLRQVYRRPSPDGEER